jgi:uncharacterized protein (TIGR03118 family)
MFAVNAHHPHQEAQMSNRIRHHVRRGPKVLLLVLTLFLTALALTVLPALRTTVITHAQTQTGNKGGDVHADATPTPTPGTRYRQTNLSSDLPNFAKIQDPLLINPWGISMTASSPFWVANNGTSTTELYRETATIPFFKNAGLSLVTIPGALPTGTVANIGGATDFVVTNGAASGKAAFLFASITGNITGWNPGVPAAGSTQAQIASSHPGHVYTGLAIASNGGPFFLYAADFANGKIDVYNSTFDLQSSGFPFTDPTIPAGFSPFNIQALGGSLFVQYAKVDPMTGLDQEGIGNGFVRKFNTAGVRDLTFGIDHGNLNSPWGAVIAPASFGIFGGALLIGNFGEGGPSINAYNPSTGASLGNLKEESGGDLIIDELWAIVFGNGGNGGDPNTLYFAAGTADEEHGLLGSVKAISTFETSQVQFSSDAYDVGEGDGGIQITVIRSGNVSAAATVNYATFDASQPGHASQKGDYESGFGTLHFLPGETSKTFRISIVNDKFDENDEIVNIALVNPVGAGLGEKHFAELTIADDDTGAPATNPIDDNSFFVRQQYLDFLGREPDAAGFAAWVSLLNGCAPGNTTCDRVAVSQSFFSSPESLARGYTAIRFYRAAFGRDMLYGEYLTELSHLSGSTPAETTALRAAFPTDLSQKNEFHATLDGLTNAAYVDRLIANAGVTFVAGFRDQLVANLNGGTETRAQVLDDIVENPVFANDTTTLNRAFVLAEYFGYLRRDPDTVGFNMWITFLNAHPGDFRTMVNGFVNSAEYRQRFGSS